MFLVQLKVSNFRGFYGTQTLDFSPVGPKAVTVIHGENGAGLGASHQTGWTALVALLTENDRFL